MFSVNMALTNHSRLLKTKPMSALQIWMTSSSPAILNRRNASRHQDLEAFLLGL